MLLTQHRGGEKPGEKRSHEGGGAEITEAVEKDEDPNQSRRDEKVCVPSQPQEVQGDLLPKVVPEKKRTSQRVFYLKKKHRR